MSLSELLPIIIFLSIIAIVLIGIAIKTIRDRRRERLPELDDYILAGFEKEYKRIKGDDKNNGND